MGDGKQASERRAEDRRALWFPVRVYCDGTTTDAVCRDLSSRGMRLALNDHVAEGAAVTLAFELPGGAGPRKLSGHVRRAQRNEDDDSRALWPYTAGVELDANDDKG